MATKALLVALLSLVLLASSAIATVEDVCKTAAGGGHSVKYDFCVSSLKSVPGSASADNQALAVIAGTLAVKQGASINSKIDSMLKGTSDPKLKSSLQSCKEVYGNAISTATDAINAVKRKGFEDAKTWFSTALDAPFTCEKGFKDLHVSSPLSNEDNVMLQLTAIALSITVNLK